MKDFSLENLNKMIDISCVRANHSLEEINQMIFAAKKYQFICAFVLPSLTPYLIEQLKDEPNIMIGGTVGFPSGCDTTQSKVFQAKELLDMGCDELDMVINITQLKSKDYEAVLKDIKAVVDAARNKPVKAIIEAPLLTNEEIALVSEIAVEAGVSYVKTGTGWCSKPTSVENIKLIKSVIQNKAKIKAAGGIRNLDTIIKMVDAGCERFGIGLSSAIEIIEEVKNTINIL